MKTQEDHKSSESEEASSSDQESDNPNEEEAQIHVNTWRPKQSSSCANSQIITITMDQSFRDKAHDTKESGTSNPH